MFHSSSAFILNLFEYFWGSNLSKSSFTYNWVAVKFLNFQRALQIKDFFFLLLLKSYVKSSIAKFYLVGLFRILSKKSETLLNSTILYQVLLTKVQNKCVSKYFFSFWMALEQYRICSQFNGNYDETFIHLSSEMAIRCTYF